MSYIHWDADPVFIRIGAIPIYYYSLSFIAGTVLSVWILKKLFQENGISWVNLQLLVVWSTVSLFVGARLGHCLFYEPDYFLSHPLEIFLPITAKADGGYLFTGYQGMASHGGALGLIVALILYSVCRHQPVIRTLDHIAIVLPLAAAFIRIGNLMNSEMIGIPTGMAGAFVFERVDAIPRHPAQLYEALAYLVVFFLNIGLYRKTGMGKYPGLYWGMMLSLVFIARFGIEFVKEKQVPLEEGMILDLGQVLSIPFILIGIVFLIYAFKKRPLSGRTA